MLHLVACVRLTNVDLYQCELDTRVEGLNLRRYRILPGEHIPLEGESGREVTSAAEIAWIPMISLQLTIGKRRKGESEAAVEPSPTRDILLSALLVPPLELLRVPLVLLVDCICCG